MIESAEEKRRGKTLITPIVTSNNNGKNGLLANSTGHCAVIAAKQ